MGLINQNPQDYYNGNNHGNYQFTSLKNIINQFMVAYVGEDKTISKVKRVDVAFHAQRALAELSFDTLKSIKAQEITVPATLQMTLPQDYVNYTKVSYVDSAGIKHILYPTSKTSNPFSNPPQDSDGNFKLQAVGALVLNSPDVVLDGEYKDILIGMHVEYPTIYTSPTIVSDISNNNGITTISLQDEFGADASPLESNSAATLTFTNADLSLILPQKSAHIVENLAYHYLSNQITGTASELTSVEVGMVVNSPDFPDGTTVVDVSGSIITTSQKPTTSSPSYPLEVGEVIFIDPNADTDTWSNYKSHTPSENNTHDYQDYQNDTYWPNEGQRYGLDPQHAQVNGSFYIDEISGKIHFSSNISGKTVILDYISDSLGTDGEMQVHKFAEEAMYKCIIYAILSTRANVQEYIVRRFKKERFAAIRAAKLRLSNIKLEELTQILRGKSKQIKH